MNNSKLAENQRRHVRINHSAEILLTLPNRDPMVVNMKNFSSSGLFLICKLPCQPMIGDIYTVQTTEFDGAPIQEARLVRVDHDGIALEFLEK